MFLQNICLLFLLYLAPVRMICLFFSVDGGKDFDFILHIGTSGCVDWYYNQNKDGRYMFPRIHIFQFGSWNFPVCSNPTSTGNIILYNLLWST